jgi:hypothetical protein
MSDPKWLPPLISFSEFGGDWDRYLDALYSGFASDFLTSQPFLNGRRCGCKRFPKIDGKEGTFWHLISSGEIENERLPEMQRCQRIRWPRPIIEHATEVPMWTATKNGDLRVHLALPDFSYLVVLADRGTYLLIWTAFCVEQQHRRDKLRREYTTALKD